MPDVLPFRDEELVLGRLLGDTSAGKGTMYEIWTTNPENSAAIDGIRRNQHEFAAHHKSVCANLHMGYNDWLQTLSCGSVKEYIGRGVVVLRAVVVNATKKSSDVVGYISGDAKAAHLHLNHFVVLPQHRGRGVGRLLFDAFLTHYGNTRDIKLEVYLGNDAAYDAYAAWGFRPVKATKRLTHMKLTKGTRDPSVADWPCELACDEVNALLRDVQLLVHRSSILHCAVRSLTKQLEHLRSEMDDVISDRFVGRWTIEDCRGPWGTAHIGPLNVGWFEPHNKELSVRELRIHGAGTERRPFRLNGLEATVLERSDTAVKWALRVGGQTTWTLEDRNGLVPDKECQMELAGLHNPHFLNAIHHQMEGLCAARSGLKVILRKDVSPTTLSVLKPRTDALSAVLDLVEKQLDVMHASQQQRKRKADLMS